MSKLRNTTTRPATKLKRCKTLTALTESSSYWIWPLHSIQVLILIRGKKSIRSKISKTSSRSKMSKTSNMS